ILLVEDDTLVRSHASGLLEGLGYRVVQAGSAGSALELLETLPDIELLFTDIVMPGGMNGAELARVAQKVRPDIKVLFTSGYAENALIRDASIKRVPKPYSREQLAAKVREAIGAGGERSRTP